MDIDKDLTIEGPGANQLTVSDNNANRVFDNNNGATTTISGLTVTGGTGAGNSINGFGGGVLSVGGTLNLNDSVVTNNTAGTPGTGGGIAVVFGGLNLNRTTVSGNTAPQAGGIYLQDETTVIRNSTISGNSGSSGEGLRNNAGNVNTKVTLVNTTVSGNTSVNDNSAIRAQTVQAGLTSTVSLINSTITNNSTTSTTNAGGHGAIWLQPGPGTESLTLTNTIVSGNTVGGSPDDIEGTADPSSSFNLIGTGGGLTNNQNGNIVGVNAPLLGPLADNGGPTETHALLTGSLVIDAGDNTVCASAEVNNEDQRGVARPQDGDNNGTKICDIGAFEVAAAPPPPGTNPPPTSKHHKKHHKPHKHHHGHHKKKHSAGNGGGGCSVCQ